MPNIEIFGFELVQDGNCMEQKVFAQFANDPFSQEMVVTWIPSRIRSRDGQSHPCARVVALPAVLNRHGARFVRGLRALGLDVEMVALDRFDPLSEART